MEIHGYDFTSSPGTRKPITQAICELSRGKLTLRHVRRYTSFAAFEAALAAPGPWVAAIDFPFGQPRKLISNLGWPETWRAYVSKVAELSMPEFVALLYDYRASRPDGDKQHLRAVDVLADSRSPMMLYGVPVGRMFLKGAPLLLRAPAGVLPFDQLDDSRVIVEGYPALVKRRWIGNRGYKHDTKAKQSAEHVQARQEVVVGLRTPTLLEAYGLVLQMTDQQARELVAEPTADELDALLCAIQAAWSYTQRDNGYGIPSSADRLEGWIVDPGLLEAMAVSGE